MSVSNPFQVVRCRLGHDERFFQAASSSLRRTIYGERTNIADPSGFTHARLPAPSAPTQSRPAHHFLITLHHRYFAQGSSSSVVAGCLDGSVRTVDIASGSQQVIAATFSLFRPGSALSAAGSPRPFSSPQCSEMSPHLLPPLKTPEPFPSVPACPPQVFEGHTEGVRCVLHAEAHGLVLSGSWDQTVRRARGGRSFKTPLRRESPLTTELLSPSQRQPPSDLIPYPLPAPTRLAGRGTLARAPRPRAQPPCSCPGRCLR